MTLTNDEILKAFSRQAVMYPAYERAFAQLQRAIRATELRGEPTCALLKGPSGSGKSKLLRLVEHSMGPRGAIIDDNGITRQRPVLRCTVPSPITVKGFLIALLARLGHPNATGDTSDLTYELIQVIRTAGIKVILFDEFQRLAKKEASQARQVTIDWLVALLAEISIPVLLAGTPDCMSLLTDAPLARRYPFIASLDFLSFTDRRDSEFVQTLKGLDEAMYKLAELEEGVHFHDMSVGIPLYAATIGNLEYLRQILYMGLDTCLTRGDRILRREDLVEACYCLSLPLNLHRLDNPFEEPPSSNLERIIKYELAKKNAAEQEENAIRSFSS